MAGAEMTCQQLIQVVTDYLEEALPARDRARFEAHLAECPYCDEYVRQMRRTVAMLGELPPEPVDHARMEELLQAFRGWRDA